MVAWYATLARMNTILVILALLVALSIAIWIVETLPLPPVPKRIGEAALGLLLLAWMVNHFHWLGR